MIPTLNPDLELDFQPFGDSAYPIKSGIDPALLPGMREENRPLLLQDPRNQRPLQVLLRTRRPRLGQQV